MAFHLNKLTFFFPGGISISRFGVMDHLGVRVRFFKRPLPAFDEAAGWDLSVGSEEY